MIEDWIKLTKASPIPEARRAELFSAVWCAHRESGLRNEASASNGIAIAVSRASGRVENGVAAALLSLGGEHGPVAAAREVLFSDQHPVAYSGGIVPGFGNSFYPHGDPAWDRFEVLMEGTQEKARLSAWRDALRRAGKNLAPNPAGWTAAVAHCVGFPHGLEFLMVVQPRMTGWALSGWAEIP